MKRFRTLLFWTHLTAGVVCGIVILVMSFTGAVLALKPQILNWVERDVRFVQAQNGPRLSPRELLTAVKTAKPDASPVSLTIDRDPGTAATVNLGSAGNVFVDPYTGAVLGTGSATANRFFQSMTSWHRYMGGEGESRATGRALTGVSNLAFLALAVTGLYIWWPRYLTVQHLRPIVWFRRGSTGRARDFNWHNTIGFWCLPAIVIMTISGSVLSYPWASNLVYRLTGSPIPAARGGGPGGSGGQAAQGRQDNLPVVPARIDEIFARAEAQVPTWSLITLRLGNREQAPVSFTITDGAHWNQFARSTVTVNGATAEVADWQPYEAGTLGQRVRGWLRFAHTGELGHLPGQIIAGLGCLGGVFLVYTGLSLAVRRLWNWSIWGRLGVFGRAPQTLAAREPAAETLREAAADRG